MKACSKCPWDPCTRGSSSRATFGLASPVSLCVPSAPALLCAQGIEKRFERLPWRHGLFLAQSISGDTAVGHALAYAHAIERLAEITGPARTCASVVLLELERLYNHTADIGALATDVAFTVPASRAQALREGLVRLQDDCSARDRCRGPSPLAG